MNYGLTDEQLQFLKNNLKPADLNQDLRFFIFGSRANGTHKEFSDIDIMIRGELESKDQLRISKIKEFFEESNFPFKVDIVLENEIADSYKDSILSQLKPLI